MVEPELTHLNQKWEEIMQKLKVSGYLRVYNKNERYSIMAEPELTHLNQKWEEIMQKHKVSEYLRV